MVVLRKMTGRRVDDCSGRMTGDGVGNVCGVFGVTAVG